MMNLNREHTLAIRDSLLTLALLTASMYAYGQVSLPNGTVSENVVDLSVKTAGGTVAVDRQFANGRWQINMRWNPAVLAGQPVGDDTCKAYPELKLQGRTYSGDGETWLAENRYSVRSTQYFDGNACRPNRVKSIRWLDRSTGNWMEFARVSPAELEFKLVKYGDKNDVATVLKYDQQGRVKTVHDHRDVMVLEYSYSGDLLTGIKDNPSLIAGNTAAARTVKYEYSTVSNGSGGSYSTITKVTDVFGNVTEYEMDGANIKSIKDAENRLKRFEYTAGRITKFIDNEGKETSYVYDFDKAKKEFYVKITYPLTSTGRKLVEQWYSNDGVLVRRDVNGKTEFKKQAVDSAARTETVSLGNGRQTTTTKDEFGNVTKIVYPDGAQVTAAYSPVHGQITESVDELGVRTVYEYDGKGNLTRKIEGYGFNEQRVTEYEYNALGQVSKESHRGKSTVNAPSVTYEYDELGNRSKLVNPLGDVTTFSYDITGRVTKLTDAKNNVWKIETDSLGRVIANTDPLGQRVETVYDKTGNRVKAIDAMGNSTRFVFDTLNRLTKSIDAIGNAKQIQYDENGLVTDEINEAGQIVTRNAYDTNGRLLTRQDSAGNTTYYDYNDDVSLTAPVKIRFGKVTREIRFDERERVTEVLNTYPETDAQGREQTVVTSSKSIYDKKGQVIESINRLNQKSKITYDVLGRVKSTTDAGNATTQFEYDERDNLLVVKDANGNSTRYEYDANNQRVKEIRPGGQVTTLTYDEVGNLTQVTDPKGNQIRYTYDSTKRKTKEQHIAAGAQNIVRTINFFYNAAGKLTSIEDLNNAHADHLPVKTTITYNTLLKKAEEKVSIGNLSVAVNKTYSAIGKVATQALADGTVLSYQYESSGGLNDLGTGLLQSIDIPGVGSISTNSRIWNQPAVMTYPGGVQRKLGYDALQRINQIQVKSSSQQTLLNYGLRYDVEGNLLSRNTEHGDYSYLYDDLQRLIQVNPALSAGPSLPNEIYSYDKLGNRTTDNNSGGSSVWQYNANNQLVKSYRDTQGANGGSESEITHQYDENGNLIQKTNANSSDLLNNQKFLYDAAGRLLEVQDKNGLVIANFQYDSDGRRIRKSVYRKNVAGVWTALPVPKTYFYFHTDEGLGAEYVQDGTAGNFQGTPSLLAQYAWEPDTVAGTRPVFIKTRRNDAAPGVETEYFYYQNDHLGTPQKIVDGQGTIVWSQRAMAFGKEQVTVDLIVNNLRLPGQYFDVETGMHQNLFRDYDPNSGRYIQRDPIGLAGGHNTYIYAMQSPTGLTDPDGLSSISGSWITPPKFNITDKGIDGFEIVSPTWSWWGYVKFIRIHAHAYGYVNVDVKCKMSDECDEKEWEIHYKIPAGGKGHADFGPNVYAFIIGMRAGPYIGIAVNILIAGMAALQAELEALQKIEKEVGPIIREVQQKGPTKICGG